MKSKTVTATATSPRVNLLPPEIGEKDKARRASVAMVGTGVAAVAVVGVLYMMQSAKESAAKNDLASATTRTTQLEADKAKLRNVSDVYARRAAMEGLLVQAMGKEVRFSQMMNGISVTIPGDVWLTEYTGRLVVDGGAAAAAPVAGPNGGAPVLTNPNVGTMTIKGVGMEWYDVAAWLEALAKQTGHINAFITNGERIDRKSTLPVKFESSADLNDKAYSKRFAEKKAGN